MVIDVRQMNEYAAGHVPGAWHINGGTLPDRLADLPRDRPIAVICEAGFRASIGTSLLRASGFDDASWVGAGFPAWRDAGFPVETGEGR
jgi:hydroxyacylglutathione hydrolase